MYRWCLFFVLETLLALAWLVPRAHAVPVPGLYVVVVQETDPQQAAQQAMRQELVRLTGAPDASADPQLASLIDDPRHYVQLQRATTSGSTQVVFDGVALRVAIMAAGRNVWDPDRPLLWIALPHPGPDASDDLRMRLSAAATARGLPVTFTPAATPADATSAATLLGAARRAGASAALLAQPAPADPTQWQWTLAAPNTDGRWTGGADSGIDGAVDALVRVAQALEHAPLADFDCHIQGVSDLTSLAGLLAAIGNTPGIVEVRVVEVDADRLMLHLKAHGSAADVEHALESERLHAAGTSADGALEYRYTAGL